MEYFFSQIEEDNQNKDFIDLLRQYAGREKKQIYLLKRPLIDAKYEYDIDNAGIILMRKHKVVFVSFVQENSDNALEEYRADVIDDINSLSDTYNYKKLIGRARTWTNDITCIDNVHNVRDIDNWFNKYLVKSDQFRRLELVMTLFIGSINDVSKMSLQRSENVIERVKQKIQMFDGEQTRFIYGDLKSINKRIIVQGLSGTGKTELLLHKLREIYIKDPDLPIGFTCHNKILADNLRKRIPQFFDSMRVNKQIDWNKLLCVNAWGKYGDPYSGIYRYICDHYNISFYNFRQSGTFKWACEQAIKELGEKDTEEYAFSYIFIDESQDFEKSFFDLCEKVTKEKVYIAGDIFQNIFEQYEIVQNPTILLSNCYRTDPKTLMIAHALGLGLYDQQKLWWLEDKQWEQCGYIVKHDGENVKLSRYPIHRFDCDGDNYACFKIKQESDLYEGVRKLLVEIKDDFPEIMPGDISIIYIDDDDYIYNLSPKLKDMINKQFDWDVNVAYETKLKSGDAIFISNRNNVKGLEFPVVICITKKIISSISYRNTLYTMLTRSFVCSYLLIKDSPYNGLSNEIKQGISMTLQKNEVETKTPSKEEKQRMQKWFQEINKPESLNDKIGRIFKELQIDDPDLKQQFIDSNDLDKVKSLSDDKWRGMINEWVKWHEEYY